MSRPTTILAHLIGGGFAARREDAATEGLSYLLDRYTQVRERFVALLRGVEPRLPTDLRFTAQQSVGGGRADMAGTSGGVLRVLIENKFEAPLTEQQPLGYLEALCAVGGGALLLFIAPARRKEELWRELLAAVASRSMMFGDIGEHAIEIADANGPVRLALMDWQTVLAGLRAEAEDVAAGDLDQLVGLCQAAEEPAWVPLEPEELTNRRFPERMVHYLDIVRDATSRASPELLSLPGRCDYHGWGWFGRKLQFRGGLGAWLGVNFWRWREYGVGPVWLAFEREHGDLVDRCLRDWCERSGRPFCCIDGWSYIHIELLTRCGRDQVVRGVIAALQDVSDRLASPAST